MSEDVIANKQPQKSIEENKIARLSDLDGIDKIVKIMCDGDSRVYRILLTIIHEQGTHLIFYLDELGIRGRELYTLMSSCCNWDYNKLCANIKFLHKGNFSQEEIHSNLLSEKPIPFLEIYEDLKYYSHRDRQGIYFRYKADYLKRRAAIAEAEANKVQEAKKKGIDDDYER